jgi:uncharacterized membrane protein YdjX (TVP38/TMEM64 family)
MQNKDQSNRLKTISNEDRSDLNKLTLIRNILFAIIVFGVIIFISIKFTPIIVEFMGNTHKFRHFILSYGNLGVFLFIGFQILHVLIPLIPGEVVQIAGGYVYGTLLGSILLYIGTMIGTIIVFYISRIVGYPVVKIFVNQKRMKQFDMLLNSKKLEIVLFVLFLIPGIPKDTLLYITGLTPIKPIRLILISTTARIPGLIGSAYIGASLMHKNYTLAAIVGVVSVILFLLGIVFRKKVFTFLSNFSILTYSNKINE